MNKSLHFKYKDNRDYVHGTDIFNEIISLLKEEYKLAEKALDIDMSIHNISRNCLNICDDANVYANKKPAIVCSIKSASNFQNTFFLYENEHAVTERYEYPEDQIIAKAKYNENDKTIFINNLERFSFIENVVALNKGLLQLLFIEKPPGKWYFTRIKLQNFNPWLLNKDSAIKIQFKKNMQFRLTDSIIFLNDNTMGNIYFSLV